MLKVVSTKQVRLGMFIQELKGAWVDHPFWKKAFKLEDPSDLKKLQASVVKEVVIDTSKGFDVVEINQEVKLASTPTVDSSAAPAPSTSQKSNRISTAQEQKQAKKIINASKKAVATMFHDVRMGKAVNAEAAMQMVDDIAASVDRNLGALISLVRLKKQR